MAKKKADAPEAEVSEALPLDVCGQPGGPSLEEQARVDQEQRDFIENRKKAFEAEAKAERDRGVDVASKVERAARAPRILNADLLKQIEDLTARVKTLEAKNG